MSMLLPKKVFILSQWREEPSRLVSQESFPPPSGGAQETLHSLGLLTSW